MNMFQISCLLSPLTRLESYPREAQRRDAFTQRWRRSAADRIDGRRHHIDISRSSFAETVEDSLAETCLYPRAVYDENLSAIAQVGPYLSKCTVLTVKTLV